MYFPGRIFDSIGYFPNKILGFVNFFMSIFASRNLFVGIFGSRNFLRKFLLQKFLRNFFLANIWLLEFLSKPGSRILCANFWLHPEYFLWTFCFRHLFFREFPAPGIFRAKLSAPRVSLWDLWLKKFLLHFFTAFLVKEIYFPNTFGLKNYYKFFQRTFGSWNFSE